MTAYRSIVDLGSNSVRVRIARKSRSGEFVTVAEDREMVRLGRSILSEGRIDSRARSDTLRAVKRFARLIERFGEDAPLVFATAAIRDSDNGSQIATEIQRLLRTPVRVLSGREEGEFLLRGARTRFNMSRGVRVVADLGGGSLQIVKTVRGFACENTSMPIGVLRLSERFGANRFSSERLRQLREYVRDAIGRQVLPQRESCDFFAGAGGAFAACEAIAEAFGVRGPIPRAEVQRQIRLLRVMDLEARRRVPGLDPKRADIIVPALCVVDELMRHIRAATFDNYGDGVRDGMLLEAFHGPEDDADNSILSAKRLLARAPDELAHSVQVQRLSVMILEQLISFAPKRFAGLAHLRPVLEVSALLHDIGVPIDYETHHVWSSRIVRSEHIRALPESDRNAVALLVQHHRRKDLTIQTARESGVSASVARQLITLSAVLRTADALDRSHRGRVRCIQIERDRDRTPLIRLNAKGDVNKELKALWKKGAGLLALIGSKVRVSIR